MRQKLLFLAMILIISLFTFYPTFKLALFGDDWLTIFRFLEHIGPDSAGCWNHLTYFFTPYGPQDILMGNMYLLFGINPIPYHILSLVLRYTAGFSLIPLILFITKDKLSALIAAFIFIVSPVGIESTNWVFNMPSFIAITFFNLFVLCLMKSWEKIKIAKKIPSKSEIISAISHYLLIVFLFFLTYVWQPIRMHGLLLFVIFLQIFWFLKRISSKRGWHSLITILLIIITFFIISKIGQSHGAPGSVRHRIISGFQESSKLISTGRFDFLFYPLISVGSLFLPENLIPTITLGSRKLLIINLLLPFFITFSFIYFVISKIITKFKNIFIPQLLMTVLWTLIVLIIYTGNMNTLSSAQYLSLLTVGGYIVIFWINLLLLHIKEERLAAGLFASLIWVFLSFLAAWWIFPASVYLTSHRYLIISVVGLAIFISILFSLAKGNRQRYVALFLVGLFILSQIASTRGYLKGFNNLHSKNFSDKIWGSMPYIPEVGKGREPLVFYFEHDQESSGVLGDIVTFGFPPHMAIIYNLREKNPIPFALVEWKHLESAVSDGKIMKAHGYPQKPVSVERIYAFRLESKNNLKDITKVTREKLKIFLQKSTKSN